jgi:glycosyltransferase involved in cell wall biosynthesis
MRVSNWKGSAGADVLKPNLRILHVARRFSGTGGVEKYVRDLVADQRERGFVSDALVVGRQSGFKVITQVDPLGRVYEAPQLFSLQSAVGSFRFPDVLIRIARRYDVVHFHYPNPMGEVSYLAVAFAVRNATVVTFHGEVISAKRFSSLYSIVARIFFQSIDRIIVTSPGMLATTPLLRRYQGKTAVIPLGIHVPMGTNVEASDVFPLGRTPRLLFVGRLTRYKGVEHLIEAMKEAPGCLIVAGEGPLGASLQQQCHDAGLDDRVMFVGHVSEEELHRLYRNADIFVLPSTDRAEGFGYVLLEAMAASLPMITTELGTGTSWVNVHGETGYVVPPSDSKELARAIRIMSNDQHLRRNFGRAARARLLKHFEFETMTTAIDGEYRRVLNTG